MFVGNHRVTVINFHNFLGLFLSSSTALLKCVFLDKVLDAVSLLAYFL